MLEHLCKQLMDFIKHKVMKSGIANNDIEKLKGNISMHQQQNKVITIDTNRYHEISEKFYDDNIKILKNVPWNDVLRYMESEFGIKFHSSNYPLEHSWNYSIVEENKFNKNDFIYKLVNEK